VLLESAGATKATTARTSTASATETRTARAIGASTTATKGLHTSKEVQAIDNVEHAIAGNGVILGFAAGERINHLANRRLLMKNII
jgi:hypothetical protein